MNKEKRMPAHVANYWSEYTENNFKKDLDNIYEIIETSAKKGDTYAFIDNCFLQSKEHNCYIINLMGNGYFPEITFDYNGKTIKYACIYFKKPQEKIET